MLDDDAIAAAGADAGSPIRDGAPPHRPGAPPALARGALPRFAGPWARSAEEVRDCWRVLARLVGRFGESQATEPAREAAQLSYGERYLLGVHAAARWTLGLTPRAPLSGHLAAPDVHRVALELAYADGCLAGAGPLRDPAAGVSAWLAWLTGRAEAMVFHAV